MDFAAKTEGHGSGKTNMAVGKTKYCLYVGRHVRRVLRGWRPEPPCDGEGSGHSHISAGACERFIKSGSVKVVDDDNKIVVSTEDISKEEQRSTIRYTNEPTADWLDLQSLSEYAGVSERTLREWIHSPDNPLPASQRGRKIFVHRRQFDAWMHSHRVKPHQEVDAIVESIVSELAVSKKTKQTNKSS